MSKSVIDANCFHDETAAYAWVEARLWPDGPVCPHCDATKVYRLTAKSGSKHPVPPGVYKCGRLRNISARGGRWQSPPRATCRPRANDVSGERGRPLPAFQPEPASLTGSAEKT